MTKRPASTVRVRVTKFAANRRVTQTDLLATEEPLEIRVNGHSVAITMRTPGHDFELAAGFLLTEGIVHESQDIARIRYCANPQNYNVVTVDLRPDLKFAPHQLSRHVYTSSSCGICGKAALDQVRVACRTSLVAAAVPAPEILLQLPETLRSAQGVFAKTGGLHATALFDLTGQMLLVREDVGRHNAVDKLIGALLLKQQVPAHDRILLVSGRASFELVQKAALGGIPILAAVGAPSSLAVELGRELGMQLIGFLRPGRFNTYT